MMKQLPNRVMLVVAVVCVFSANAWANESAKTSEPFDKAAVFDEVVEIAEQHFFDPVGDMPAWRQAVEEIRDKAIATDSHDAFSVEVNRLLATLGASHTFYYSKLNPKRYQLLGVFHKLYDQDRQDLFVYAGIGFDTHVIDGKRYVRSVYDGLPAAMAGIQFGDEIVSVDDEPFHPIFSFVGKEQQVVQVDVVRNGQSQRIGVKVDLLDGRTMFETALSSSVRVLSKNGQKVGYIHPWSYAGQKYHDLVTEAVLWGDLKDCDSLVVDLRDGWGGAGLSYLNLFREPIVTVSSRMRNGEQQNYTGVWGKPVALITNGGSTSGKELLTFGFKKLHLGKVFGETTAGAVLAGRIFLLSNDDVLYLAVCDLKVDGVRLDGVGVAPDVEVKRQYDAPQDAPLDAAVEYLRNGSTITSPHE
jgi:carboxyl-terminal processing protease